VSLREVRQHKGRAIVLEIGGVVTPDLPFCLVVTAQRDNGSENRGMMQGDIHGPEASHGETSNGTVSGVSKGAIVLIDIGNEIASEKGLDQLALIVAIAPFTGEARATVAVWRDEDEFAEVLCFDESIGGFMGLAASEPVAFSPWSTVQEIEHRIALSGLRGVGWGQINNERAALIVERGTDEAILFEGTFLMFNDIGSGMDADIGREEEEGTGLSSKYEQDKKQSSL
jgi:hypothetical protein